MTPPHRRYVVIEACVGALFTAIISLGFALLVFHGRSPIPLRGLAGMIADAVPQSFAGSMMCVVVPTLLTRRRLRHGLAPATGPRFRPVNVVARGFVIAIAATGIGLVLHAALLLGPPDWPFAAVVAWKVAYGAALGFVVGALAASLALRDG